MYATKFVLRVSEEGVMPSVKHVKAREVRSGMWPHFIRRSQWVLVDVKTH
jgi:hypothetical protein